MDEARPAAIVLAAGGSSRLGQPKQLVSVGGESLVRRTARLAIEAGFAPVLVVCGCERARVQAELRGLEVAIADNPGWPEGLASSIRTGVAALPAECPGVLLLVCDQLALELPLLERLRARHARQPQAVLASRYAGTLGVPAVFPRALFPELSKLQGNRGARELLRAHADVRSIEPFPGGELDLDTPDDLQRLHASARNE